MLIYLLVIQLHLQVMFSDNAMKDCGLTDIHLEEVRIVAGCYDPSLNKIILQLGLPADDQNWILAHEIGHRLFLNDTEVKNVIRRYLPLFTYSKIYDTQDKLIDEMVADYFAAYIYDKDFGKKYPELKELFD
jgi:Zn-dependent peptidase ImmA (M78 family)